jgi:hypothetical protein
MHTERQRGLGSSGDLSREHRGAHSWEKDLLTTVS